MSIDAAFGGNSECIYTYIYIIIHAGLAHSVRAVKLPHENQHQESTINVRFHIFLYIYALTEKWRTRKDRVRK